MSAAALPVGPLPTTLAVAFFRDVFARAAAPRKLKWGAMADRLARFPSTPADTDKLRLPCWSPTQLTVGADGGLPVVALSCLVLDLDGGLDPTDALRRCAPFARLLHTSWRHRSDRPRFRIVLPLARPVASARWAATWRHAVDALDLPVDRACVNANRRYILPAQPVDGEQAFALVEAGEGALDLRDHWPEPVAPPRPLQPVVVPNWRVAQVTRQRLATDPDARRRTAQALGAQVAGFGSAERAAGLACPSCGRPSVWFLIGPDRASRARCNHRGSCGWTGPLTELLAGAV